MVANKNKSRATRSNKPLICTSSAQRTRRHEGDLLVVEEGEVFRHVTQAEEDMLCVRMVCGETQGQVAAK